MKNLPCMACVAALVAAAPATLAAEDSGFYAGIGTGRLDFDFGDATFRTSAGTQVSGSSLNLDVESGLPLRLSAGYNRGGLAFEVGYEHMLKSVDIDAGATNFNSFDYSNFTLGGVYRSSGELYVLGKFGLSMPNVDARRTGSRVSMGNSAYYGAGIGYRFTQSVSAEFDFTQTNDDTGTFMLSLRKHF